MLLRRENGKLNQNGDAVLGIMKNYTGFNFYQSKGGIAKEIIKNRHWGDVENGDTEIGTISSHIQNDTEIERPQDYTN